MSETVDNLPKERETRETYSYEYFNSLVAQKVSDIGPLAKYAFDTMISGLIGSITFDNIVVTTDIDASTQTICFCLGLVSVKTVTVTYSGFGNFSISVSDVDYLLLESGDKILLETGDGIIL